MKKQLSLNIEIYKNGTVMIDNCGYSEQTYESGIVDFIGTIDGRRKTFNPMETMEKAGLVTTKHDESMFPNYKATEKLYKVFTSTGFVLCFSDNTSTRERLNSLIEEADVPQQQALTNLKNAGVISVADAYQLSDKELKTIILK